MCPFGLAENWVRIFDRLGNDQNSTGMTKCNPSFNEDLCSEAVRTRAQVGVLNHSTVAACLMRLTVPRASEQKLPVGQEARGILSAVWNRPAES